MTRHFRLLFLLTVFAAALAANGDTGNKQNTQTTVYMFGFAASFSDTIVHFTEIQRLDSVWITPKQKFLAGRENYSNQLRDYLSEAKHMPNRTCIVMYGFSRKKLEKTYLKMKRQYSDSKLNNFDIRTLGPSEFSFNVIDMGVYEEQDEQTPAAKAEKKKKPKKPRGRGKPMPAPSNM